MLDITVRLTDAQVAELGLLDPRKTPAQVVQTHVNTWLAPLVAIAQKAETDSVARAYVVADAQARQAVRDALKLDEVSIDARA